MLTHRKDSSGKHEGGLETVDGEVASHASVPSPMRAPPGPWWANIKVMGLDPSPELLAISMGEPRAKQLIGLPCAPAMPACYHATMPAGGCTLPDAGSTFTPLPSPVYFVQGILGLSRLALSFFYKDDLHLDPAQAGVLMGIGIIPWMIKPIYGFISDSIPLFGYRRRSYLFVCGLLGEREGSGRGVEAEVCKCGPPFPYEGHQSTSTPLHRLLPPHSPPACHHLSLS
jgi:hypothetical protein